MHSSVERVAQLIREQITSRGISQDQIAHELSMSQAAVSRRLCGEVAFNVEELAALARYLDVPIESLVAGAA